MYEPFEAQIKEWRKDEPALSAAGVLQRLAEIDPARFKAKNIRTVQRLAKAWRMEMAGWSSWMVVGSRPCPHHLPPRR
ncbi:hypothetical protein [Rhizobium laguerreae]|uniref:hypothetical protein n=1 Tax=Rhizobium laguerreae TaxID=1076926 RepID=UPI0021B13D9B|nr:hypothetical protein [Rhizobium laguerreae]